MVSQLAKIFFNHIRLNLASKLVTTSLIQQLLDSNMTAHYVSIFHSSYLVFQNNFNRYPFADSIAHLLAGGSDT